MRVGWRFIAFSAALCATAAIAQPDADEFDRAAKSPEAKTAPTVVLASATDARRSASTAAGETAQPVRRPAPRVTTCRCGDPQVTQGRGDEDQPQP